MFDRASSVSGMDLADQRRKSLVETRRKRPVAIPMKIKGHRPFELGKDIVDAECMKERQDFQTCLQDPIKVDYARENFKQNFQSLVEKKEKELLLSRLRHLDDTLKKLEKCDNLNPKTFDEIIEGGNYYDIPLNEYITVPQEGNRNYCFGKNEYLTAAVLPWMADYQNITQAPTRLFVPWEDFNPEEIRKQKRRSTRQRPERSRKIQSGGSRTFCQATQVS